jgi:hypothetical protein
MRGGRFLDLMPGTQNKWLDGRPVGALWLRCLKSVVRLGAAAGASLPERNQEDGLDGCPHGSHDLVDGLGAGSSIMTGLVAQLVRARA